MLIHEECSEVSCASQPFAIHPHMLRYVCGFKLANDGPDTPSLPALSRPHEYSRQTSRMSFRAGFAATGCAVAAINRWPQSDSPRLANLGNSASIHQNDQSYRQAAGNKQRAKDRNIFDRIHLTFSFVSILSAGMIGFIIGRIQLRETPPARKACQRSLVAAFCFC